MYHDEFGNIYVPVLIIKCSLVACYVASVGINDLDRKYSCANDYFTLSFNAKKEVLT